MAPLSLSARESVIGAFCLVFVLAAAGFFARAAWRDRLANEMLTRRLDALIARRARLEEEARRGDARLRAIEQDPFTVERNLREQMRRSRPGEILLEK